MKNLFINQQKLANLIAVQETDFVVSIWEKFFIGTIQLTKKKNLKIEAVLVHKNLQIYQIPNQFRKAIETVLNKTYNNSDYGRFKVDFLNGILVYSCKINQLPSENLSTVLQYQISQICMEINDKIENCVKKALILMGQNIPTMQQCAKYSNFITKQQQLEMSIYKICTKYQNISDNISCDSAPKIISVIDITEEDEYSPSMMEEQFSNFQDKLKQQVMQIEQNEQHKSKYKVILREGGYFYVKTKWCELSFKQGENIQKSREFLVVKSPKYPQLAESLSKMENQLYIVNKLQNKTYISDYIVKDNTEISKIYMRYSTQHTLRDFIYYSYNNLSNKLKIIIEIIKAIHTLHQSNIIHRDIKPSNILIEQDDLKIKIIDFAESYHKDIVNVQKGSTMPYSPAQFHSIDKKPGKLPDYSSDVWSLGIMLYELFQNRVPIKYIKFMHLHIIKMWQKQYKPNLMKYSKKGLKLFHKIIRDLTFLILKVNMAQRLKLENIFKILKELQKYHDYIDSF